MLGLGGRLNGTGRGMRPWFGGRRERVMVIGAQNICRRNEHVGSKNYLENRISGLGAF